MLDDPAPLIVCVVFKCREERLKESMREALENERTAKSALFKREQAEAESERLREAYDVLVGQFEAIKSQVELEKLEAQGIVTRYEKELEDVYGKLNAKDEYAGLLCGVKKDMDVEMTDLWARLEAAEEAKQKVEQAFLALGGKHRAASARRIFNFMVVRSVSRCCGWIGAGSAADLDSSCMFAHTFVAYTTAPVHPTTLIKQGQSRRMKREALCHWRAAAKANWDSDTDSDA